MSPRPGHLLQVDKGSGDRTAVQELEKVPWKEERPGKWEKAALPIGVLCFVSVSPRRWRH